MGNKNVKGITGEWLVITIGLIILVVGLVFTWIFLSGGAEAAKKLGEEIGIRLCTAMKDLIKIPFLFGC